MHPAQLFMGDTGSLALGGLLGYIAIVIRQELLQKDFEEDREVAGAITFIYDHHQRDLLNKIIDVQHDHQYIIQSSQHIHLDHHNCLEIVAVKGNSGKVKKLADTLRALKGVKNGSLSVSGTG